MKSIKKAVQKGFTLIELMIVIAIIGILAAIAIPAYQDYIIRAQVSEAQALAGGLKAAVADFYASTGNFPAANVTTAPPTGLGLPGNPSGKYGTMTLAANGVIQYTFASTAPMQANARLNALVLGMSPGLSLNQDLVWVCGRAATPTNVTPPQANGTSAGLQAKWLPATCK